MRFHLAIALLTTVAAASAQSTAPKPAPAPWVGTWAASPFEGDPWHITPTLVGSTLREVVHTSIAGKSLRIRLTNEFGTALSASSQRPSPSARAGTASTRLPRMT